MGCQRAIADQIIKQGANYVLSLKENQQTLHVDYVQFLNMLKKNSIKKCCIGVRLEKCTMMTELKQDAIHWFQHVILCFFNYVGQVLQGIGQIELTRTVNNEVEYSTRYFLTSMTYESIDDFMSTVKNIGILKLIYASA